jgi:hypothetical protein
LKAAGVPNPKVKQGTWSKAAVVEGILARQQTGKPLNYRAVARRTRSLCGAARRYFGSWGEALRAAGIDIQTVSKRRTWTVDGLVRAIHALQREGARLNYASIEETNDGLRRAAAKLLGSWDNALRAAGYDPGAIRLR